MTNKYKTCSIGHKYLSDLPICPTCFPKFYKEFNTVAKPAQRALYNAGIESLKQLSKFSKKEILALHGMGQSSIPRLEKALANTGLSFKE